MGGDHHLGQRLEVCPATVPPEPQGRGCIDRLALPSPPAGACLWAACRNRQRRVGGSAGQASAAPPPACPSPCPTPHSRVHAVPAAQLHKVMVKQVALVLVTAGMGIGLGMGHSQKMWVQGCVDRWGAGLGWVGSGPRPWSWHWRRAGNIPRCLPPMLPHPLCQFREQLAWGKAQHTVNHTGLTRPSPRRAAGCPPALRSGRSCRSGRRATR